MSGHNWFQNLTAPLLAAELQYFRTPRPEWERLLLRLRQLGANTVSTYVSWGWHEPQEGQLDFQGQTCPERDLLGFIHLVQEMGFWLILKPGPFIDAETLGGGIPTWLLDRLPEAHARRPDGSGWRYPDSDQPRLSYLHPQALEAARRWLAAFSQVASDWQFPRGPVIALQLDNEIPGEGFLPGNPEDNGYDFRFRGDYNPYLTHELWPEWLQARHTRLEDMAAYYGRPVADFKSLAFPASWVEPRSVGDLRLWMDAARFIDWTHQRALRLYAVALREAGWQTPFYQNLFSPPWDAGGLATNQGGLALAAGWQAQNIYPETVRTPLVEAYGFQMGFEEYVQHAFWRARLAKNYSPELPGLASEVACVNDFFLQALFAGGVEAACIYPGVQSNPEPPGVGVFPRWGMEAPLRPDGSLLPRFWNGRSLFAYLQAGGRDFTRSRPAADLVLGYTHLPELLSQWFYWPEAVQAQKGMAQLPQLTGELGEFLRGGSSGALSQALAQQMVQRQIDFDVLDLDFADPAMLDPAKLVIIPATSMLARRTQQRLASFLRQGGRIAWVGGDLPGYDETLTACRELSQAAEETGRLWMLAELPANWPERLLQMGYLPRYAWSDALEGIDVSARYAADQVVFIAIANRTRSTYEGAVHYLDSNRQIQTIKIRVGGLHASFCLLKGGRLQQALLNGNDGAAIEVAGERYAIDRGQAALLVSGSAFYVSASQAANIETSRMSGWGNPVPWRLALDGRLLPYPRVQISGEKLAIGYEMEADSLETLLIMINPARKPVELPLRQAFDTHLAYLQRMLLKAAGQAHGLAADIRGVVGDPALGAGLQYLPAFLEDAAQQLEKAASGLAPNPSQALLAESYAEQYNRAILATSGPVAVLLNALRSLRTRLASEPSQARLQAIEQSLVGILDTLGRLE